MKNKILSQLRILHLENLLLIKIVALVYSILSLIAAILYLCVDKPEAKGDMLEIGIWALLVVGYIAITRCFDGFTSGMKQYVSTMLPASSNQKLLARFIVIMIILPVVLLGTYLLINTLVISLSSIGGGWEEVLSENKRFFIVIFEAANELLTVLVFFSLFVGAYIGAGAVSIGFMGLILILFNYYRLTLSNEVLVLILVLMWIVNFIIFPRIKVGRIPQK